MIASRSAAKSVRSWRSSSLCTSGLLFFATDADAGPRDCRQPCLGDGLAAVAAHAVDALIDALQRFIDRLENFGIRLFQLQLNVNFIVATGLVGHIALTTGVVLHRPLQRLGRGAAQKLPAFAQQRV